MMAVKTDKITKNGLKNSNNTDFISYFVYINIDYYTLSSMRKYRKFLYFQNQYRRNKEVWLLLQLQLKRVFPLHQCRIIQRVRIFQVVGYDTNRGPAAAQQKGHNRVFEFARYDKS